MKSPCSRALDDMCELGHDRRVVLLFTSPPLRQYLAMASKLAENEKDEGSSDTKVACIGYHRGNDAAAQFRSRDYCLPSM